MEPEESVFLDDLGVNLKPARLLGMHTIKVTDPGEALAELTDVLGHPVHSTDTQVASAAASRTASRPLLARSGRRRCGGGALPGEAAEERAVPDGEPAGVAERAHARRGATGGEQASIGCAGEIAHLPRHRGLQPAQREGA